VRGVDALSSSLARRLERYREYGLSAPTSSVSATVPSAVNAAGLAVALGGYVVGGEHGGVVVIESEFEVSLDAEALARLPFGVEPGRPLVTLDTETTGLATAAGTLAFLVGVGAWAGGRLRVRQFLLPDHSAEAALLDALGQAIPADAWLVTYNGRSFDWPLLVGRYRLQRRDPPPLAGHLDLLHVARRLWKHRLGNARLATVEQAICRVDRYDDLPGALIPERYFTYLRERDASQLRGVIDHNRQDVVSLGLLLGTLARLAKPDAWRRIHPGDIGALGRGYARSGDRATALACLEAALASRGWDIGFAGDGALWRRLAIDRARLLARLDRRDEALSAWLDIARRGGPGSAAAWLHVARHREHVERDVAGALDACAQAFAAAERARLWGRPVPAVERDLAWRMSRLRRRVGRSVNPVGARAA
jgi:uncharacterized protein